ncbi:LacI family DNA-binding transcriptional regulator [Streptomyces sp. NPDC091279]|uniref:LacI family DNA-binding transcriptional regulator n=1 Tax=unclassified Streptomyces TaxID=2593676 RepID=UPI00382CA2BF
MPTIQDVARLAGVSTATVSRALSGSRPVGADLTRRVQEAASQLGYRHNALAQALRTQRSRTIGMVVPQISNPFFPLLVEAVERRLQIDGVDLLLCDSHYDLDVEARRLRTLTDRHVDGIIISPLHATDSAPAIRTAAGLVPVIQIDRQVEGLAGHWVGVDDAVGFGQLVDLLVARGRRRLVFVSSELDNSSARDRAQAFEKSLARHGLEAAAPALLGRFDVSWGLEAARRLVEDFGDSGPSAGARGAGSGSSGSRSGAGGYGGPDGVVCGDDLIALGVLRGLSRAGVSVPDQVAVTGFDDIAFAEISDPPLTTMRQQWDVMADECARLLRQDPAGGSRRIAIAPLLQVRGSTPRSLPR